jgi:hypothetical protein
MRTRFRTARVALGLLGGLAIVLGLAQLLLPSIAAQRLRSEIGRYGVVRSASVSAFPAIELLWGSAQSSSVSAADLSMDSAQASELLWSSRGVSSVELRAESMRVGSLTLHDVTLRKRGSRLDTSGSVNESDLRAVLPGSTGFQLLGSSPGGVEMRVSGSLFGVASSIDVLLSAQSGDIVAQPLGVPFAGLVKVTLLAAPHMYVQSFNLADSSPGADPAGASYLVSIGARLR